MCKANMYTNQLIDLYNKIDLEYKEMEVELLKYNAEQQDILHKIESETFNASQGYLLAKQIKENRMKRRIVKNEFETLKLLKKQFLDNNMSDLISLSKIIKTKDETLTNLSENKIYNKRVVDDKIIYSNCHKIVEKQKQLNKMKENTDFVSDGYMKRSKARIQIISEDENNMCLCVIENLNKNSVSYSRSAVCKKNIVFYE